MPLKRLLSKLKTNSSNFRLYRRHLAEKKKIDDKSKGAVYFDIRDPALERYFYALVKFFEIAGYSVKLRKNFSLLLNLRNYSDLVYNIRDLEIVPDAPRGYDLWITDHEAGNAAEKKVRLDTAYFKSGKEPASAVFSYSMHPLVYEKGLYRSITELQRTKRNIRLFSYSANLDNYESDEINNLFKLLNRKKVLLAAAGYPETEKLLFIKTADDLPRLYEQKAGMAIVEDVRIEFENWLETLSRADFFIAPPGVIMPFSHNLIEAMAVGTVPVTQYGDLFTPPLTDMVNCVSFASEADLQAKIKTILEMDDERVAGLRAGAARYYDEHFRPETVVANLMKRAGTIDKLYLLAGHLSVDALREELNNARPAG